VVIVAQRDDHHARHPAGPASAPTTWIGAARARLGAVPAWLVTFHVVCLGWVLFRAASLDDAAVLLGRLFSGGGASFGPLVVPVVVAVVAAQFAPARWWEQLVDRFARWPAPAQALGLAGALTVIDVLGPVGVAPFIYFQF